MPKNKPNITPIGTAITIGDGTSGADIAVKKMTKKPVKPKLYL